MKDFPIIGPVIGCPTITIKKEADCAKCCYGGRPIANFIECGYYIILNEVLNNLPYWTELHCVWPLTWNIEQSLTKSEELKNCKAFRLKPGN